MRLNRNRNFYSDRQKQHFSIRKLSVGVASVLLSTTFYLGTTGSIFSRRRSK
ncbi:MAG: YSIRK-type signal peptide-containing protein [Lactobacillus sp.]|nr:YSIRK-type signal peptide-containing protein [Lactobacillus sp.]